MHSKAPHLNLQTVNDEVTCRGCSVALWRSVLTLLLGWLTTLVTGCLKMEAVCLMGSAVFRSGFPYKHRDAFTKHSTRSTSGYKRLNTDAFVSFQQQNTLKVFSTERCSKQRKLLWCKQTHFSLYFSETNQMSVKDRTELKDLVWTTAGLSGKGQKRCGTKQH